MLILRNDMPMWEIVGGLVDEGETYEEALHREIKEEIDVVLKRKQLVGDFYRQLDDLIKPNYLHLRLFKTDYDGSRIHLDEHVAYEWFDTDKLPKNITPLHQYGIEKARQPLGEPITEKVVLSTNGARYVRSLEIEEFYALNKWMCDPKVIAKREKGEIKFDPFVLA